MDLGFILFFFAVIFFYFLVLFYFILNLDESVMLCHM